MSRSKPSRSHRRFLQTAVVAAACVAAPCAGAQTALSLDGQEAGRLDPSDALRDGKHADSFEVHTEAEPFEVVLRSDAFDTFLMVTSPSGREFENDDYDGSTSESRVVVGTSVAEAGVWRVRVTSFSEGEGGAYRLSARRVPPPPPREVLRLGDGPLDIADTLRASLPVRSGGQHIDWFPLDSGGASFEVRLEAGFDPFLVVEAPDGSREENDDHEGSTSVSYIRADGVQGPWRVGVSSFAGGQIGPYRLRAQALDPSAPALGDVEPTSFATSDEGVSNAYALGSDAPPTRADTARAVQLLRAVEHTRRMGHPPATESSAQNAVDAWEALFGRGSPMVSVPQTELARAWIDMGRLADADSLARRALATQETVLGPGHIVVARTRSLLGLALLEQGRFRDASAPLGQALNALEQASGPESAALGPALNGLGRVEAAEARFDAARDLYARALRVLSGHDPTAADAWKVNLWIADTHYRRARLAETLGDQAEAERELHLGLRAVDRALGADNAAPNLSPNADHPARWPLQDRLARLALDRGNHAEARRLTDGSMQARRILFGETHPAVAESYHTDALLYWRGPDTTGTVFNEGAQARARFDRALTAAERTLPAFHPMLADVLADLALAAEAQGDVAQARAHARRAYQIREAVFGPDHPDRARAALALARLTVRADADEADALAARALAHPVIAGDPSAMGTALRVRGAARAARGDREGARTDLEEALGLTTEALGAEHPETARVTADLAALAEARGDLAEAVRLYRRAHRTLATSAGEGGVEQARVARALGVALLRRDPEAEEAAGLLRSSAQTLGTFAEETIQFLSIAEQRALTQVDLPATIGALLALPDRTLRESYDLFGGWKGLLLWAAREQAETIADRTGNHLYERELQALRQTRSRIVAATLDPASGADLDSLTLAKERLEREVVGGMAAMRLGGDSYRITQSPLDNVQTILSLRDAAFVDVYRVPDPLAEAEAYVAVVVTPGNLSFVPYGEEPDDGVQVVRLGAATEVDERVRLWRETVTDGRAATNEAAALIEQLWAPVAEHFPEATRSVWVSPDASLARVPWSTLAAEHDEAAPYAVAQIPSSRQLLALAYRTDDPVEASPGALLVGGVAYGEGASFAPLPGTAAEVASIAQLEGRPGSLTRLTGAEPTPSAVADAMQRAEYVHLATHGFFFSGTETVTGARGPDVEAEALPVPSSRNPLAESGLALAPSGAALGALTAEEIIGLDLSGARLVVLSACNTGRGAEAAGQGVLGLQTSFTAAGARALLMSLWPVPDASTSVLMASFYEGLWRDGLSPAAALRRAQAAVRSEPGWEAPLYWAGWALTGDAFEPIGSEAPQRPSTTN